MEFLNKRVLVLGGWGLVGMAVCRRLLQERPDELIVASLSDEEAREAAIQLRAECNDSIRITPCSGNLFVREELRFISRSEILENPGYRRMLIEDVLSELSLDILERSWLFQIIQQYRPHVIIDCVNSATALAYQDIFSQYYRIDGLLSHVRTNRVYEAEFVSEVEKLMCTLYVPQLIRHVQILYDAMRRARTMYYLKIGTSGTGGMGLNIPYTHSEEKPSRVLLSKSAIAGAHTMLLFLMARTPDAPITKEIKPTAAIAWKSITYGQIKSHGKPIQLYDCPPERALTLDSQMNLRLDEGEATWDQLANEFLTSVYVDTGENGIFSLGEFAAISDSGQMELVTPEEIAKSVIYEIKGGNTGHDIINALDNSVMGPTYRAGLLRHTALQEMKYLVEQHGCDSVAFELLGPPRLSKLLYEAHLLKLVCGNLETLRNGKAEGIAEQLDALVKRDRNLRAHIISIGIPILMGDGKHLLRGPVIKIPPFRGNNTLAIKPEKLELWAHDGWVDLRIQNVRAWQRRAQKIYEEVRAIPEEDSSSRFDHNRKYWLSDESIDIGKVVGWIFSNEEKGLRMKD